MMTEEQLNSLVEAKLVLTKQVAALTGELRGAQAELRVVSVKLQAFCHHTFEAAPRGFEHEGPTCLVCGVNAQHIAEVRELWNATHPDFPAPTSTDKKQL